MDFGLSDEQLALQETAHRFSAEEIVPIASACDASGEFPMDVMKKAYEIGLSHVTIPAEYDGVGLSMLDNNFGIARRDTFHKVGCRLHICFTQ